MGMQYPTTQVNSGKLCQYHAFCRLTVLRWVFLNHGWQFALVILWVGGPKLRPSEEAWLVGSNDEQPLNIKEGPEARSWGWSHPKV
jgi:hypothetical protein